MLGGGFFVRDMAGLLWTLKDLVSHWDFLRDPVRKEPPTQEDLEYHHLLVDRVRLHLHMPLPVYRKGEDWPDGDLSISEPAAGGIPALEPGSVSPAGMLAESGALLSVDDVPSEPVDGQMVS